VTKKQIRQLELDAMFQPRYSGEDSRRIWNAVNKSNDRTLYDFGCALQDAEGRFLAVVNGHVALAVRAACAKKGKKR
jgi:hypothetical protein